MTIYSGNRFDFTKYPSHSVYLFSEGWKNHQQKNYAIAEKLYLNGLDIDPNNPEALNLLGILYHESENFNYAIKIFESAIPKFPNNFDLLSNYATALQSLCKYDEAIKIFEEILKLSPNDFRILYNIGNALKAAQRYEEAKNYYIKAFELDNSNIDLNNNLGVAYYETRDFEKALKHYSFASDAGNIGAKWNRATLTLSMGDMENGWKYHEIRHELPNKPMQFNLPYWKGDEDLAGKTILVHCEQGLGDTLQFCRYLPMLKVKAKRVILLSQAPVFEVLRESFPDIEVVTQLSIHEKVDFHTPLMTLPLAFKTTLETIPNNVPYLVANKDKVKYWKEKMGSSKKLKVGLVWNGGFRANQPSTWITNNRRNMPLSFYESLKTDNVDFYSVQKGADAEKELIETLQNGWNGPDIINYVDEFKDYSDTAAFLMNLDLLISVDTSVVHMAGALGKKVWMINRFDSCWRWLIDKEDTPWYPNQTIYNQDSPGNWLSAINKIKNDLVKLSNK